jgi:putative ABC transport system permease protein
VLFRSASDRSREFALRAAIGAGRLRIVRQMLTESMLLALAGGVAGLLVGWGGAKLLVSFFPGRVAVPRLDQTRMDTGVLLFTLGLAVATGLIFGLIPAWQATRANLSQSLKKGGRASSAGSGSHRLRNALVVAETTLSLVLLVGAGLMLRSFGRLLAVNPGFRPERVLTLRVPMPPAITDEKQQPAYYTRMLDRLRLLPGLTSVGLIAPLPLADVDANSTFVVEGHVPPNGERQLVKLRSVNPGYFRAMGLTLRAGRLFDDTDTADAPRVAVISDSLARKYFPNENPIGRRITGSTEGKGPFTTVIGVVNDVRYIELGAPFEPEMYRDYRQFFFAPFAMTLVLRTQSADPMQVAATAQREIRAISPDQPVNDVRPMERVISENVSQPRFYTVLLGVYAAIALLLAATGLYGVLAYTVSQRLQEIGIRMALGASAGNIVRMVIGHALLLVSTGLVLGLAGSWALTRLIATQLYQTEATDPATFAAVSLIMAAVALAATWIPAQRAARVDPIIALRCE